ncbi:MAG: signal peptidase I [Citromicrobium sp.]|nr:signal peptidase I [Citromicrobium sp.]
MADSTAGKKKEGIWETVKTIFWALVIAGIFRTLFFQPFWIPSGSMKDTLLIGDFLFVNKMAYGYSQYSCPFALCPISGRILGSDPERGDVVVFRHPTRGVDFIKRVIGLPGAMMMGLGSIIGTGVFVSLGIGAGIVIVSGKIVGSAASGADIGYREHQASLRPAASASCVTVRNRRDRDPRAKADPARERRLRA